MATDEPQERDVDVEEVRRDLATHVCLFGFQVKPQERAELTQLRARCAQLEAALRRIQIWDCLNPPDPQLCADHPWLRDIVDAALNQQAQPIMAEYSGSDPT